MGENEQGGMLRTVVVVGLVAIIAFVVIVSTVAIAKNSQSSQNDTVSKITDAANPTLNADDTNYNYKYSASTMTASIYALKDTNLAKDKDVIVPGSVIHDGKTYVVTEIESSTFADAGITGVSLPDSIQVIGSYAFKNNLLTSISLPNSLTSIADGAFLSNRLTSVTIPNGVTTIGKYAFQQDFFMRRT